MAIEEIPLSPNLGLEVRGVDLTRLLTPAEEAAILDAWIRAGVLLFRGAGASDEIHMRLSRVFGQMEPAATADMNNPDNPYLMTLAYDPEDTRARFNRHYVVDGIPRAGWLGWHWDQSFMPTIVRGAVLRMTRPAAEMGETGFIDAIAAYDRLSPELKRRIEGLEVVYEFNPDFTSGQFGFPKDISALPRAASGGGTAVRYDFPPCVHPLVITQQETGRKVLKLSPMHSRYVLGMDKAESDALLEELANHLCDERYAYFHPWGQDDMVVWDNWRVIHSARGVPLHCRRQAMRTTIMGDYKVGRYLDPALDRDRKVSRLVD
ncbi:TauD/TfdA family dioxygenase [Azospirillum sp. B4]|uniref:TauD/TfdA dioxygenase family protein n=1 Tax=Azospirillum sp. B4 TaxID=95605 RepID=UPI00034A069A|nr:TauD/TfdA family dioxygenase [Azospirillum sp. B4]